MYEAMSDLIAIMNSLVDKKGKILIPGVYDSVAKVRCLQSWLGSRVTLF